MKTPPFKRQLLCAAIAAGSALMPLTPSQASDHRDGPTNAYDAATDIGDIYFFKDPGDDTKVVMIATTHGFIVPGEAANEAIFDPVVRYRFEIFNKSVNTPRPPNPLSTDTAAVKRVKNAAIAKYVASVKPDKFIDVTFTPRVAVPATAVGKEALQVQTPQSAKIVFTGFEGISTRDIFTAAVLNPSLGGTAPLQSTGTTTLAATALSPSASLSKITFFAGETDDPFFFDIPAFGAFIGSVRNGAPDVTKFNRARDTFAGYDIMSIAISLPIDLLTKVKVGRDYVSAGKFVGIDFLGQRHAVQLPLVTGDVRGAGAFKTIDRAGNPAVNVVLVPFNRKNSYNVGTPKDDANLKFALDTVATRVAPSQPGILSTLAALGTTGGPFDGFGVSNVGTLAAIAVLQGDLIKLDTTPGVATAFPNGRRLQDDVVDTLLNVVTNGALTTGDKVDANEVPFGLTFPFLAPSNQPLANGAVDNTQN